MNDCSNIDAFKVTKSLTHTFNGAVQEGLAWYELAKNPIPVRVQP